MTHGQQVIDFEQSTGTLFEPGLQAFFLPAQWVIDFANQVYLNAQFSIAIGFLLWLYLFRNESYYFVRNMFVVAMGIALVGYTVYPTAPPRMFPQHGFVDTINDFSGVNHDSCAGEKIHQPLCGGAEHALRLRDDDRRDRRDALPPLDPKVWWACWPLLVSWVTIVTANHYWVDVALGWLVALAAVLAAQRLARARPEAWAFRVRAKVAAGGGGLAVAQPASSPPRSTSLRKQWNLRRPPGLRAAVATVARPAAPRSSGPTLATA